MKMEQRKKTLLGFFDSKEYVPMRKRDMMTLLRIPSEDKEELTQILEQLVFEGSISMDTRGRYHRERNELKEGTFSGTRKGIGFVMTTEGEELFIDRGMIRDAWNGDVVQVMLLHDTAETSKGKKRSARVMKVLKRAQTTIVGTYEELRGEGFVTPDDKRLMSDLHIDRKQRNGCKHGQKVVVKIKDYGDGKKRPEGIVTEVLGDAADPKSDLLSVLRTYQIEPEFPPEVTALSERVPDHVTEDRLRGRLDLRELMMITIDGEDAKDLDDAVSLTVKDNGYELGVHIADVSEYVTEDSPLDREARKRGTSVYLIDHVIPMLPKRLSNGICSLNAGEDRLTLSCLMEVDKAGNILGAEIAESVIRVNKRTSYTEIAALLATEEGEEQRSAYGPLLPMIRQMYTVSKLLRRKREDRGAIDFDFPESKIILDENGAPKEIKPYERNDATRMIEDFMLAANETVAEHFHRMELPFVYRVHENPEEEKLKRLAALLANLSYTLQFNKGTVHPKTLQKLLLTAGEGPKEALTKRLVLRSMRQARYAVICEGHYGLATQYYCHFTSPIRRYPDLQIHRIMKESMRGTLDASRLTHYERILPEVAEHSSKMERTAEEAEREFDKLKKCEYAANHIGDEYEGIVSGITSYGFYVELMNTVEGMVRLSSLWDDFYDFDEARYCLMGQKKGRVIELGQSVVVRIQAVDKMMKTIDFFPVSQ